MHQSNKFIATDKPLRMKIVLLQLKIEVVLQSKETAYPLLELKFYHVRDQRVYIKW